MSTAASYVPTPACGSIYNDLNSGASYQVHCSEDNSEPSFETVPVTSGGFGVCFSACDGTPSCVGFTYYGIDSGSCYLKASQGTYLPSSENMISCFKILATVAAPSHSYANYSIGTYYSTMEISIGSSSTVPVAVTTSMVKSGSSPSCLTDTSMICDNGDALSECSSSSGNTYDLTCGIEYEGSVIFTPNMRKRANEPTFQACQMLCDDITGCLALNYEGTNCTLLSAVTGISYVPGAVGASLVPPSSTTSGSVFFSAVAATQTPQCPGSAGEIYTDSAGTLYGIGCYTEYTGNDIGSPISESSFVACLPYCDIISGCVGVEFDVLYNLCYLKSSFAGLQSSNTSLIYGMRNRAAPGLPTYTVTPTDTSTTCKRRFCTDERFANMLFLALATGATITVQPTTTIISIVPPGGYYTSGPSGSYYVYTSAPTGSMSAINGSGSGSGSGPACLCYTCALTPTLVTGSTCGQGGLGGAAPGPPTGSGSGGSKCTPRPGIGVTTFFSTQTITSCGMPAVCPASGYVIGGNATQSGATVVTTTDMSGHTVTYTQIPTSPGGGGNDENGGNGGGGSGGNGGGGYGGTPTTTATGNAVLPTCPYSNNVEFTSPMGMQYNIFCNELFTDIVLDTQTQSSLAGCISACDMYNTMSFMVASPCMGVSWYSMQSTDNCLLKTGYTGVYQRGVDSARLMSPYTGPGGGGNGTGPGGNGGGGDSGIGSMTAPPIVITYVTGGSTIVTSYVTGGSTIVTGGSTYVTGASTVVSTYVGGGSTVVQTVSGGGGGGGGSGGTATNGSGGGGKPGTGRGTGAGEGVV